MILYFKHVIHIDDFPLNGQPPSYYYEGNWDFKILNGNLVFLLGAYIQDSRHNLIQALYSSICVYTPIHIVTNTFEIKA